MWIPKVSKLAVISAFILMGLGMEVIGQVERHKLSESQVCTESTRGLTPNQGKRPKTKAELLDIGPV